MESVDLSRYYVNIRSFSWARLRLGWERALQQIGALYTSMFNIKVTSDETGTLD